MNAEESCPICDLPIGDHDIDLILEHSDQWEHLMAEADPSYQPIFMLATDAGSDQ